MSKANDDDTVDFVQEKSPRSPPVGTERQAPPHFPGYVIEGELGKGGLGIVYRARDLMLNRPVALKVLTSDTGDEEQRQKVLDEARRTAALGDRCIVTIFGVLEHEGNSAIAMELVDGHELQNVASVLEPRQVAKIIAEVCRAVSIAHGAGILHRDLKPQNIVVTPAHEVKILDFGLSIEVDSTEIEEGFSGTISYSAPERLTGQPATEATDIFSIGVLFHEVLTGRHPFAKLGKPPTISSILAGEPSLPREHRPEIPEELERVCLACLSFNAEDRPSAIELLHALDCFLSGRPVQLKASVVKDHLLNRIEDHVNEIEKWQKLGLVRNPERDHLRWQYRRILEGDDVWPTETLKLRAVELGIYISTWTMLSAAFLSAGLYREEIGTPLRWTIPLFITFSLVIAGVLTEKRSANRVTPLFFGSAILSLMPTLMSILTEFLWVPETTTSIDWLRHAGVSNKTLLLSSLICMIASVLRLNKTGVSFYAWLSSALFLATHLSVLLQLGFLDWSPGARAVGILSTGIAWLVGSGFEMQRRPRFARPFHWIGAGGTMLGLYMLAAVPLLSWIGVESLARDTRSGWSFAISGFCMLGIGILLDRSPRLERRRIAKFFEWACPIFILGGLYQAAMVRTPVVGWEGQGSIWFTVIPFIGAVAMFVMLTAKMWKPRFMISCLGGVALSLHLLQHQDLISKTGVLIFATGIGLLLTAIFYMRMERTARPRAKQEVRPPSIHDD